MLMGCSVGWLVNAILHQERSVRTRYAGSTSQAERSLGDPLKVKR